MNEQREAKLWITSNGLVGLRVTCFPWQKNPQAFFAQRAWPLTFQRLNCQSRLNSLWHPLPSLNTNQPQLRDINARLFKGTLPPQKKKEKRKAAWFPFQPHNTGAASKKRHTPIFITCELFQPLRSLARSALRNRPGDPSESGRFSSERFSPGTPWGLARDRRGFS